MMRQRFERARRVLKDEGAAALVKRVIIKLRNRLLPPQGEPVSLAPNPPPSVDEQYPAWIERSEPTPLELAQQAEQAADFAYRPLISVLTPVFRPEAGVLLAAIQSVQAQTYPNWELCLVDGGETPSDLAEQVQSLSATDERIRWQPLERNLGISGNTNAALALATGDFVALLDQDDLLAPNALFAVAQKLNADPTWDVLYSDHDLLTADGSRRHSPLFKPGWSPEILLSCCYITHLTVLRTELVRQVGGFDPELDGAQDWDLFLRVSERTQRFAHLPQVLYHWRDSASSTAADIWAKPYAPPAQLRAIRAHLGRLGLQDPQAFFDPSCGFIRVYWTPPAQSLVSIIIPSKGVTPLLQQAISSIIKHTRYTNYEIVVVNNGPQRPESFPYYQELLGEPRLRVVHYDGPFNYNTVNNFGVSHSQGELLLFLNNDIEVFTPDWLDELVLWALRPEVGAVGAKLLFPNGTIQHAGAIIGLTGFAGHVFWGQPENQWSIFGLAEWYRNFQAVTGACLMLRREVFERLGGFNESFILCGSDVELCLRVWQSGLRVVYNPFARLKHWESATRSGSEVPANDFHRSYPCYLPSLQNGDPFFNPNLSSWQVAPTLSQPNEPRPLEFVEEHLRQLDARLSQKG